MSPHSSILPPFFTSATKQVGAQIYFLYWTLFLHCICLFDHLVKCDINPHCSRFNFFLSKKVNLCRSLKNQIMHRFRFFLLITQHISFFYLVNDNSRRTEWTTYKPWKRHDWASGTHGALSNGWSTIRKKDWLDSRSHGECQLHYWRWHFRWSSPYFTACRIRSSQLDYLDDRGICSILGNFYIYGIRHNGKVV